MELFFAGIIGIILIALLICILILIKKHKPQISGNRGERLVSSILSALPSDDYTVLNNIVLKTWNGTSQIDHVVVSKYGIFVIETKNINGIVKGSENSDDWMIICGNEKHRLHNPIKQNYGHIMALRESLNLDKKSFISIVVFTENASLRIGEIKNVIHSHSLLRTIKSYNTGIITDFEKDNIVYIINKKNMADEIDTKQHIENIHNSISQTKEKVEKGICPKCGNPLVKRKGQYGMFWGCSKYPYCNFTKKI